MRAGEPGADAVPHHDTTTGPSAPDATHRAAAPGGTRPTIDDRWDGLRWDGERWVEDDDPPPGGAPADPTPPAATGRTTANPTLPSPTAAAATAPAAGRSVWPSATAGPVAVLDHAAGHRDDLDDGWDEDDLDEWDDGWDDEPDEETPAHMRPGGPQRRHWPVAVAAALAVTVLGAGAVFALGTGGGDAGGGGEQASGLRGRRSTTTTTTTVAPTTVPPSVTAPTTASTSTSSSTTSTTAPTTTTTLPPVEAPPATQAPQPTAPPTTAPPPAPTTTAPPDTRARAGAPTTSCTRQDDGSVVGRLSVPWSDGAADRGSGTWRYAGTFQVRTPRGWTAVFTVQAPPLGIGQLTCAVGEVTGPATWG